MRVGKSSKSRPVSTSFGFAIITSTPESTLDLTHSSRISGLTVERRISAFNPSLSRVCFILVVISFMPVKVANTKHFLPFLTSDLMSSMSCSSFAYVLALDSSSGIAMTRCISSGRCLVFGSVITGLSNGLSGYDSKFVRYAPSNRFEPITRASLMAFTSCASSLE